MQDDDWKVIDRDPGTISYNYEPTKQQNADGSLFSTDAFRDTAISLGKGLSSLGTGVVDALALGASQGYNALNAELYEKAVLEAPKKYSMNAELRKSGVMNPEAINSWWNDKYSEGTKQALQNVSEAEGFWDTLVAYAQNPRAVMASIAESAPAMLPVFGTAGKAYKAAEAAGLAKGLAGRELENYIKRRVMVASGAAEGAVSSAAASQAIGQDNLENGRDYSEGQGWALPIGVTTGVIGQLNPMEANIMTKGLVKGVLMKEAIKTGQPVSMLKSAGGALGRAGMSAVKEGGEEVAQGVFETGFTNLGQKKEFMDDQGKSAAENFVVGGAMGVGMHPFTNGGFRKGSVEQAVNNNSSQQGAEEAAARPKTELNPEEQSQIAQAATDAQNPNSQAQQPVETQAQEPMMSPEEAELAQMEAEESARRQAVIDKYGLEFNREHGAAFADVTRNITDEAEKDFHAKILQAAGMMGIKNPFKEKEAAANFATEYKTFGGDLAKLAEFYRNIGIKAENDAGKKQGALRQAEFYQQLADLLEGGELLNFEQRRARKEEKKAAQAAEIQAAQVQQTAEQMMAQEPAPVEVQPEVKTQPVPKAKPEVVITAEEQKLIDSEEVPTGDALGILSPSQRKRVYEAHVDKLVAAGKIGEAEAKAKKVNFPMRDKGKSEQKFVTLWNLQHKRSWGLADQEKAEKFRARLAYIKKADLGIASGINTVSNKLEDIIAKRDPNKLDEFISKNENRIQAKIRLKNAINDGVSEERVALIRKLAEAAKTEEDWAGVNKALMDEGASDTLGVAPKEAVVKTNKDGAVEVESKDTKASSEEDFILRDQAREKLDRLLENRRGSYKKDLKDDEFDKIGLKREDALTNAEEEVIVRLGTDEDKAKLQQLLFKDQTVDIAQRRDENLTKQSKENEDKFNRRMGSKLTPEMVEEAKKKEEELKKVQAQAREKRGELYRKNWNELDDGEKLLVAQALSIAHENLPTVSGKRTGKTDKILGAVLRDKEKRDQFKAIAVEELGKKGEAVSSGTSDTVYSAQANLDAHGKSIPRSEAWPSGQLSQAGQIKTSAIARDQNLSEQDKATTDKESPVEEVKFETPELPKMTPEKRDRQVETEAGTDLEVSNRRPTSRIPESNITQTNSINKTTADKEPVVINATIPEGPFEKKEEAPKKTKFEDALKKAFDEAKEKAKTEGESKPVEIEGSALKPPKDPFKGAEENKAVVSAVEGKEQDAKAIAKAEMKVRSILESMQDYLDGKRKKRLSENQVDLVNELKDKGFLFVDDEKVLDDYKKRIETKFGKSTRHASKSAKTDPETSRIRGLQRFQEALENKTTAHHAMWSPALNGWVDFDYGKIGSIISDSFLTQGAMGVSHIVDKRSLADKLSPTKVAAVLRKMVSTLALGGKARKFQRGATVNYDGFRVNLGKLEGSNHYVITAVGSISSELNPSGWLGKSDSVLATSSDARITKDTGARDKNVSELVKIIADQKLLFKGDELKARKASKSSLTEKQKKQNYNDVRNGLNKSWGVSTTKELLDSGKVVICDSNEGFIDTIVKDYLAKDPSLSEDEVRNTLHEEGLDKGTNAIYDENTGKVYINGENVDENEAGSVLAHEIGVHAAKDSEFKGLVKDIEDRVATLMAEGLKSKNPAVKKFWEDVKRRMDDADVSDNEERLAYFLEVYVKRNGVIPQSIQSEMYQAIGQLKDWLLKFLGIKSINEHKAAELLCDVVRAYADQSAMEKGGVRHASKKGKNDKSDKPKKPRKQLTPEEKEKKEKEKLAKMTPSQRASYERRKKIADLKKEVQKQKDFREGEAYRDQKAQEEDMKDFNDLQGGKPIVEVVKSRSERASGMEKQAYAIGEKVLAYLKRAATYLNFRFLKFTNELVNDIGERCPAAKVWYNELLEWGKDRQKYRAEAQEIFSRFDKFPKNVKDEVESLLFDSTTSGQWAFDISDWKDAKGNNLTAEKYSINPELEARFDELAKNNPQAAMVVYDTLKHGYDRFIQIKTKIDTVGKAVFGDKYRSLIKMSKSVMPYVPLVRTGQYNVVWRSHQLKAEYLMLDKLKAERDAYEEKKQDIPSALTNAIKNTESKIDAMERNENHYVVSRFDSLAKAIDFQSELNGRQRDNQATLTDVGDQQKKSLTGQANIDRMLSDFEEKFEEHYGKGMGVAMRQTVQEMLLESAQKTLHSATKQRRNIAGANPHVMETFMHHANTDAWMLSNLDHGKKISNAFTTLYKEVEAFRNSPKTEDQKEATELSDIYNELARRYNFITKREDHGLTDDVVEGVRAFNTFSMLSLKPAYYIQNALQPTMMTMPYLSGEFGVGQTMAQMKHSYGEWLGFVKKTWGTAETKREKYHAISNIMDAIQGSKLPEDIKEMLLDMERLNLLDLGAQADFGSFRGNNALLKMANKGMTELGYLARSVELANRYVTATAAYRMMKTKLLSQKATKEEEAEAGAKEYAAKVLSKTQGDYSGINAPSAFNTKWGKVALQFRKFQAIQLNYFLDMAKGSFKGMTKDERGVYQKQLTVAIATHLVMAGMNGAPAMAIGYMLAGALFGDDGEDGEDTVRRLLSEAGWSGDMIDIAMEGPLSAIGINLSNSVGAGQMFSPVPYTRKGLTEEGGMMEFLTSAFGGATASRLIRLHTGAVQSKESNNWGRPFWEAALPAGIPQMLKAAHIIDPTVDKRTGAKMLKDEDFTVWHSFVQALGFTPSPVERMYQMRNVAYKTQKAIKEEKGDLTRRWIDAMKNRDYKAQSEIRKDLIEHNKDRRAKGFKPVSMNDLMTAWKTRQKEEKLMQKNHGLKLPSSQQGFAKQLNKIYN